jgi:hypothetical protein
VAALGKLRELLPPTFSASSFARVLIDELNVMLRAGSHSAVVEAVPTSLASFVAHVSQELLRDLVEDADVVYAIIEQLEPVEALNSVTRGWCERFSDGETQQPHLPPHPPVPIHTCAVSAMQQESERDSKKEAEVAAVLGFLLASSNDGNERLRGMAMLRKVVDERAQHGGCLQRLLKATVAGLSIGGVESFLDEVDDVMFRAQESGMKTLVVSRLFEDCAYFVVQLSSVSGDARAVALVAILSKWVRVSCKMGAATEDHVSAIALTKAMVSQLEIALQAPACGESHPRLVAMCMSAVETLTRCICETDCEVGDAGDMRFGERQDLLFIAEQVFNVAILSMADPAAVSELFARSHDLAILATDCAPPIGTLTLHSRVALTAIVPPSAAAEGASDFSTMCMLLACTAALDAIESGSEGDKLSRVLRTNVDLLGVSMDTAASPKFAFENAGFCSYLRTLSLTVSGANDGEVSGFIASKRKELSSFLLDKEDAVDKLLSACRVAMCSESALHLLSLSMDVCLVSGSETTLYGEYALMSLEYALGHSSEAFPLATLASDTAARIISSPELFSPTTVTAICVLLYNASVHASYIVGRKQEKVAGNLRDCAASIVAFADPDFRKGMGREVTRSAAVAAGEEGADQRSVVDAIWGV